MDDVEIRAVLEAATEEALELADELASRTAMRAADAELAQLAANYMQTRILVRRLRRALAVEVAG